MREHTIDANNKRLGRVATEAATVLQGKDQVEYAPNVLTDVKVTITNSSELDVPARKQDQKVYDQYSGYPGGRKTETLREVITKKGKSEVIRRAIYGMLPGNKLRSRLMKQLVIEE